MAVVLSVDCVVVEGVGSVPLVVDSGACVVSIVGVDDAASPSAASPPNGMVGIPTARRMPPKKKSPPTPRSTHCIHPCARCEFDEERDDLDIGGGLFLEQDIRPGLSPENGRFSTSMYFWEIIIWC